MTGGEPYMGRSVEHFTERSWGGVCVRREGIYIFLENLGGGGGGRSPNGHLFGLASRVHDVTSKKAWIFIVCCIYAK
jgi:hypothetical protein